MQSGKQWEESWRGVSSRGLQAFTVRQGGREAGRKALASAGFAWKREGGGLGLADGSGVCPVGGYTFVLSQSEKWNMSGVETTCLETGACGEVRETG